MSRLWPALKSAPPAVTSVVTSGCPFGGTQTLKNPTKISSTRSETTLADFSDDSLFSPRNTAALPVNAIPGPKGLPLIGTLYNYIKKNGFKFNKLFEAHAFHFEKYGPFFRENIVGRKFNVLGDLREWRTRIIQQEPKCPQRVALEPMVRYRKMRNLSQGLVNSQGEEWFQFRSAFDKKLLAPKEIECHFEPLSSVADDFITHLQRAADPQSGIVYNIENEVFKWSLESICAVLFRSRLGCFQEPPSRDAQEFISNCRRFFTTMQTLMYEPPYKKWFSSKTWDEFVGCSDALLQQGISMTESVPKDSLAHFFIHNSKLKREDVTLSLLDLIIGAMETSTKTMIWSLYCLAKWQDAQERMKEEVTRVIGQRPLQLNDLKDLPLVKASLKETLRLYPAPFVLSRIMQSDTNVRGYNIPAGEEVVISLWAIGHDEKLFPDHKSFIPERWLEEHQSEGQRMYWSLPFGHGRRMCIGRRIAEMEIYILLSKLVARCRLEYPNAEAVEPVIEMTLAQDRPVHLRLVNRQAESVPSRG